MTKIFVLDTNVLVIDPLCIQKFEENDVVIPVTVLEELDKFKTEPNERGKCARQAIRNLKSLMGDGWLDKGVPTPGGGTLRIYCENTEFKFAGLKQNSADNYILGAAKRLGRSFTDDVILVTNDYNLALKASAFGIKSEEYENERAEHATIGTPRNIAIPGEAIDKMCRIGSVAAKDYTEDDLYENEYLVIHSLDQSQSVLARYMEGRIVKLQEHEAVSSVKPRNCEQRFLMDALMDDSIKLVVASGQAGAGKTLLSLAAGLNRLQKCKEYDRITITRSAVPADHDIGFLPGDKSEKMAEWVKPYFDNFDYIMRREKHLNLQDMLEDGRIEIEALTYIRGRSLMNSFVIIDEVQNLTPRLMRTIVTRVSESAKLILLGDPTQIDDPYLDSLSNGLIYTMDRMRNLPFTAFLTMQKTERGRLAKAAAERL